MFLTCASSPKRLKSGAAKKPTVLIFPFGPAVCNGRRAETPVLQVPCNRNSSSAIMITAIEVQQGLRTDYCLLLRMEWHACRYKINILPLLCLGFQSSGAYCLLAQCTRCGLMSAANTCFMVLLVRARQKDGRGGGSCRLPAYLQCLAEGA